MIDIFFILFTGGMAVFVIVRAVILDKAEPWYEITAPKLRSAPRPHRPPAAERRPRQLFNGTRNPARWVADKPGSGR
jgi:hypothetical protein